MSHLMRRDLVTVIVPVYNVEKYLDVCVQSIVNQTYRNLEILLIDDGSPDNCPQMCEEWAERDSRIRVIHQENQGLGMARNTGIEHATGEYICYFDSDDFVDVRTIEIACNALVQNHADYALFGYAHVFPDGHMSDFNKEVQKNVFAGTEITDELLPWLIQRAYRKEPKCPFAFSAWSGLLRRKILEEGRLRFQSERQIISEDTLYLLELYSRLQRVVLIPKALYFYRINPASLTKTYRKERQNRNNSFLTMARDLMEKLRYSREIEIRLEMLYHGFTIAAMKHIVSMPVPYHKKRQLLSFFFEDSVIIETISKDVISRCGMERALFLICFKYKLELLCFIFLWFRENVRKLVKKD